MSCKDRQKLSCVLLPQQLPVPTGSTMRVESPWLSASRRIQGPAPGPGEDQAREGAAPTVQTPHCSTMAHTASSTEPDAPTAKMRRGAVSGA